MFDTSTSFQILSFLFVEYSSEVCLDEICLQLQASTLLCWKYVSDDELESFLKNGLLQCLCQMIIIKILWFLVLNSTQSWPTFYTRSFYLET